MILDRSISGSNLNQLIVNVNPETIFFLDSTGSLSALTASTVQVGNCFSSSYAETASLLLGSIEYSIFSNNASSSISSSYAATASYAFISASQQRESFILVCSDETTPITASAEKISFRMPYAFNVESVRASLTTAQTSGNVFTVDINENFTTILSTKITIDNTETTSTTAATASVISDSSISDDSLITIDVDQVGVGAKGLKVAIIGRQV